MGPQPAAARTCTQQAWGDAGGGSEAAEAGMACGEIGQPGAGTGGQQQVLLRAYAAADPAAPPAS